MSVSGGSVALHVEADEERPTLLFRVLPIVALEVYLNCSLALYAFGPWEWHTPHASTLYSFVLAAHFLLLLGYVTAVVRRPAGWTLPIAGPSLLRWSAVLTLLLFLPTARLLTGGNLDVLGALANPGEAYNRYQSADPGGTGGTNGITYLRFLCAPLLAGLPTLLAYYWRRTGLGWRFVGVAAILANLSMYVLTGRNKGFVDLLLLMPWLVVLYVRANRIRVNFWRLGVASVLVAGAILAFSSYFSMSTAGRIGPTANVLENPIMGGISANEESPLLAGHSPFAQLAVLGLSFNQTHGYTALALALQKDWTPTWGLGHSAFLQLMAERVTGHSTVQRHSYPGKLQAQNGWDITQYWHTTYTWLASDLSFPGTLVAMFLLGRLFGAVWLEALAIANPLAISLLPLLISLLYNLPTNNVVLGFGEPLVAFWTLVIAWGLTRTRRAATSAHIPSHAGEVEE